MTVNEFLKHADALPQTPRMPVIFVGHGNPMNAIERNRYSESWRTLGTLLPRIHAILAISAHWYTDSLGVHVSEQPRIIYDFFGFPPELYKITYPVPGAPSVARATKALLSPEAVAEDICWGIDHGTWSVLVHMFPNANIPVFQLSIDARKTPEWHFALGKSLAALRDRGILIFASGNLVHNLGMIKWDGDRTPYQWAIEFDALVAAKISNREFAALADYRKLGEAAELAVPTPEHYLPLLYALGTVEHDDAISFPIEGIDLGSIGMRAVYIG